jgi:hypothetical protein
MLHILHPPSHNRFREAVHHGVGEGGLNSRIYIQHIYIVLISSETTLLKTWGESDGWGGAGQSTTLSLLQTTVLNAGILKANKPSK